MVKVNEYLTEQLARWGVTRIYGVTGDAILPWLDSLGKQTNIEYIRCRHESTAAMMASAEAKLTGKPAVCIATSGPGTANLINGLADAHIDHVPVVVITGQVETYKLGGNYKQYIDQQKLYGAITHYSTVVAHPNMIGQALHKAFVGAISQKGVTHLSICKDMFTQETQEPLLDRLPDPLQHTFVQKEVARQALEMMAQAKKPLVLLGVGTRDISKMVQQFVEQLGAGVLLSLGAKGVIPHNHPQVISGLGDGGTHTALQALQEVDLLVILGSTWFPRDYIPNNLPMIQVDENLEAFHAYPNLTTVLGQLEEVLPTWVQGLKRMKPMNMDWLYRLHTLHDGAVLEMEQMLHDDRQAFGAPDRVMPQTLIRAIEQAVNEDALIALDTGEHTVWFNRVFRATKQQPLFSGKWRTMGYGLPAAIAAKKVYPDRQVVAIVGDGGLLMALGELMTLREQQLPITIFVVNNGSLGLEEHKMQQEGFDLFGTRITNPDFTLLGQAFGLDVVRIEHAGELPHLVKWALSSNQSTLVDVSCTLPTLKPIQKNEFTSIEQKMNQ
ncbi:thiamine pyrophosphate-binding protein [Brevibacillus dissolubilis]|uniref:thiamine pyrophosphate-binding protein n=1 Tax=Brevibacillus dissolubilis TaxID=1844116 RepID=UPI00210017B2|nr:thiamine pyrophosphate-binding protein [Brevibacillus dissolubilis]